MNTSEKIKKLFTEKGREYTPRQIAVIMDWYYQKPNIPNYDKVYPYLKTLIKQGYIEKVWKDRQTYYYRK